MGANGKTEVVGREPLKCLARNFLLDQIRRGVLKPGQHIPSVKQLSESLNVSTFVAFSAIKELREERFLERLANGRHLVGRDILSLSQKRALRVGFSSCGLGHIRHTTYQVIYNELIGLGQAAHAKYDCLLEMHDRWSSLEAGYYDALVVADWKPQNASRICRGPCIGLDTWEGIDVDCVVKTDHHKGGELAGRHLRECGRKRAVYWDVIKEKGKLLKGMRHRYLGFMKGWVDAGGDLDEVTYLPVVQGTEDIRKMIGEHARSADAFFVFCDSHALLVWDILNEMGVRVPEDIALVGFDGTYEAMKHAPALTTVRQPCQEIAQKVQELMLKWADSNEDISNQEFQISPVFVRGGST